MIGASRIGKGFDRVSWIYDGIAKLVFGNKIQDLQTRSIRSLTKAENTLILGGGSGKILRQTLDADQAQLITYCEASVKMLDLSRNQIADTETNRVHFVHSLEEAKAKFSTVILPFILDCYKEESIDILLTEIEERCQPECEVLIVDFSNKYETSTASRKMRSFLIWALYQFFFSIGATETKTLPNIDKIMTKRSFRRGNENLLFGGWITSTQWTYAEPMMTPE